MAWYNSTVDPSSLLSLKLKHERTVSLLEFMFLPRTRNSLPIKPAQKGRGKGGGEGGGGGGGVGTEKTEEGGTDLIN